MSSNDSSDITVGNACRHLARCASTNDEAAGWAREDPAAPHGAIVLADEQTRGRGRLGRAWHSPPGENLYFSAVLRPPAALDPRRLPPLTLVAAVALAEVVASCGVVPSLKWPNDVLVGGRKLAGILTESSFQGGRVAFVVVGIGVNLATTRFPDELADRATSLARAGGRVPPVRAFAAALWDALDRRWQEFLAYGPAPAVHAWKERAAMLGSRVTVQSGAAAVSGVAEDLDRDGALLVRTDGGGVERVLAGEVLIDG